jgi:hypothetical protein
MEIGRRDLGWAGFRIDLLHQWFRGKYELGLSAEPNKKYRALAAEREIAKKSE